MCVKEIEGAYLINNPPIKLGSYRSSVSGAFLYVRNRYPSLLYLLGLMLDRVIAVVSKTQTSKLQTSDLENLDLETSDPLKND